MVTVTDEDSEDDIDAGGSGGKSIAGYDYQIDVSVWLALDLVLASRLAQELILEPAQEEDLEADLAETEPGRLTSNASLDGYRLIVQAKLRSGDAWTVPKVKALLQHGDKRPSASKRLEDSRSRYLLVTTAGLNGGTRKMSVRRAGSWPKPGDMPSTIEGALPKGAAGRVAIIGNEDEERLVADIKTILTESFRVPNARLAHCVQALRDQARARIGGAGGGRWTRPQLERVIRRHDGYIASSPELDDYVHPTNWQELRAAMRARYAALIVGQSGTGKTMATRKLFDELRADIPGLTRVPITLGPEQLRDDTTELPVLYDIEDPWGRYDFDPHSRAWNDQLAHFLAKARPGAMIVATSRQDVAQASGAIETVKPWLVGLEAEHYGPAERRLLYRNRIEHLPRKLQQTARQAESTVLAKLATPLEIQKFFDALSTIEGEERGNADRLVAEAIRRAHQNSIEQTVVDQIEQRDDVRAAAVIWGLLKANDKLSLKPLRQIEEDLGEHGPQFEKGVTPLVNFFVAARNLRQTEPTVTYYHPRVEAGIERALSRNRVIARRTLGHLINTLVARDAPGEVWGLATSARMLLAMNRVPELKPEPSHTAQQKLDSWLANKLAKGGKDFEPNLELAAAAGSRGCNAAEMARFLLHKPERSGFGWMHSWAPPERDEAWYARMRADETIKPIVETFVREVLPYTRDDFNGSFVAEAERVASDLTPAFLAAAATTVRFGVTHAHRAIATGALNDLAGFEAIIDAAVEARTMSDEERERDAETRLAIANGEFSEDYVDHLSDNDDGWTAGEFVQAYVERVRATVGWRHLEAHRHRSSMLFYWFRELGEEAGEKGIEPDELAAAFAAGQGTESEDDLWHVLAKAKSPSFQSAAEERILNGHPSLRVRVAALTYLIEVAPTQLSAICQKLTDAGRQDRLVDLAIELGERFDGVNHEDAATSAAARLPPLLQEVCDVAMVLGTEKTPTLSKEASELVASAAAQSEDLRVFRLNLDKHLPMFVPNDVRWLLEQSDEAGNATAAIEAAIRHDMTAEIDAGLGHRFADVAARALKKVAAHLEAPLPERLLALAAHKGSPVRKALVELLDAKPSPAHLATLVGLAKDDWGPRSAYYGEDDDYPIAQAAVAALGKLGDLDESTADDLYRLALNTRDPDVRADIFTLLVQAADKRFQAQLFELAVNPGRRSVRLAASAALLVGHERVENDIVARVTPQLLKSRIESVVSRLLLLFACRAEIDDVVSIASALSTNEKRRVLLLLVIWVLFERDKAAAGRVARMLPINHIGVQWALAGAKGKLRDTAALDDLGDPASVEQVLQFMAPKREPS